MNPRQSLSLRLAKGWLLFVPIAAVLEFVTYSPPYSWLSDWMIVHATSTDALLVLVVVTMTLLAPAISMLRRNDIAHPSPRPALLGPQAARRVVAHVTLAIAAMASAGAVVTVMTAQSLPQRSDPPRLIDLASLGDRAPALGSVRLTGMVDQGHRAYEQLKLSSITYAPFAVPNRSKAPIRFFLDHATRHPAHLGDAPAEELVSVRGVLVPNGLPRMVKRDFELQGVRIAAPYYFLETDRDGPRETIYVGAGLLALLAALMLGIGITAAIMNLRDRRAAKRTSAFTDH